MFISPIALRLLGSMEKTRARTNLVLGFPRPGQFFEGLNTDDVLMSVVIFLELTNFFEGTRNHWPTNVGGGLPSTNIKLHAQKQEKKSYWNN